LLHALRVSIRHLIVDGANVLHAWAELRQLAERDRAAARSKLGQMLLPIHDVDEIRVTLVFDGRGEDIVIERPFNHTTFSTVYTPSSLTADDVIEQMVANSTNPAECRVATNDNAVRETVEALGAVSLRSEDLAEWTKRAESRQVSTVQNLRAANTRAWKKPEGR
jgi:predicted RNA-binding protein with PIN domain